MNSKHKPLKFGTDGLRGVALSELRLVDAFALGKATAEIMEASEILVAADPRESSPALAAALAKGFESAGGLPKPIGIAPTPAVAWLSARHNTPAAMISASHNPYTDNGIKLFSQGGLKLSDQQEDEIEDRYLSHLAQFAPAQQPDSELCLEGFADHFELDGHQPEPSLQSEWVDSLASTVDQNALKGLKVVIDASNGAAYQLGAAPYEILGAEVELMGNEPTGKNINTGCGSTDPSALAERVIKSSASVGLAFDGDADRLIAVDELGQIVDGDRVIALLATAMAEKRTLRSNQVVVTVMSNLGFHRAMKTAGIDVLVTDVGDRNVLAALEENDLSIGGEQSGHVICRDYATTGDGMLAGVQLLALLGSATQPLSLLASQVMQSVPQILKNVKLPVKMPNAAELIAAQVSEAAEKFGEDGRILVRPSGTEPLLRIMVEHIDESEATQTCDDLVAAAEKAASSL